MLSNWALGVQDWTKTEERYWKKEDLLMRNREREFDGHRPRSKGHWSGSQVKDLYRYTPYEELIAETRNHRLSWATRNHIPNRFTRCPSKSKDSRVREASTVLGGSWNIWIFNYHKLAIDCPLTRISLPFLAFKFWMWSKFHYNIFTKQRRTYKNTCQNLMNKKKCVWI